MIPILYESENLSIHSLWVFVVLALLLASYLAVKRLKRRRLNLSLFIENNLRFVLAALLLSRIVYFFSHQNAYFPAFDLRTLWNFISIWDQGLSFWGAVLGFALMLIYTLYKRKEDIWKWLDALIVPLFVGMIIGNLGAFLGGHGYGIPTELPWGVRYQVMNVKYTVPIHPTQLYAVFFLILLLWSKNILKKKTKFFELKGASALYLSSLGSLGYFALEFLRGDDTLLLWNTRFSTLLFALIFLLSTGKLMQLILKYKSKQDLHGSPQTP